MALKNYLVDGSYTTVSVTAFDKRNETVVLKVHTYTSETKDDLITEYEFEVRNRQEVEMTVLNHISLLNATGLIKHRLYMSTVPNQSGPWDTIFNTPAQWVPEMQAFGWVDEAFTSREVTHAYRDVSTNEWYISAGDGFVTRDLHYISQGWNTYFQLSVQENDGENIIKKAYEYLKQLPSFQTTEDA